MAAPPGLVAPVDSLEASTHRRLQPYRRLQPHRRRSSSSRLRSSSSKHELHNPHRRAIVVALREQCQWRSGTTRSTGVTARRARPLRSSTEPSSRATKRRKSTTSMAKARTTSSRSATAGPRCRQNRVCVFVNRAILSAIPTAIPLYATGTCAGGQILTTLAYSVAPLAAAFCTSTLRCSRHCCWAGLTACRGIHPSPRCRSMRL